MSVINGNDSWNDLLNGTSLADTLNGLGGNDTLYGYEGIDVLNGGAGDDWLVGGSGNDTYKFPVGSGNDTVGAGNATDSDMVDFGTVKLDKLNFVTGGSNLIAQITGNDSAVSTITLEDWMISGNGVKKFKVGTATYTNTTLVGGTAGADFLVGSDTGVSLGGAGGADILVGGSGNDSLDGNLANDGIYAGDGNDTITSGAGSDYVQAGAGNDWILYKTGDVLTSDTLAGGDGVDTLDASAFTTALSITMTGTTAKISGIEVVLGGSLGDTVKGGSEDNSLAGNGGKDLLDGGTGNDWLDGGNDNDTLTGGAGNDTLAGGAGNDVYSFAAGYGDDLIVSDAANANDIVKLDASISFAGLAINQVEENLVISTGSSDSITLADWYSSDTANVTTFMVGTAKYQASSDGTAAADFLIGSGDADDLAGGAGNDFIYGGDGDDILRGGAGSDMIFGGDGADQIIYAANDAPGSDSYANGGTGDDTLDASAQISAVTVNLTGTVFTNIENVIGGSGGDVITGGNDSNFLDGGAGNDNLRGMGGADSLLGGSGIDTIDGGIGDDLLTGGAGNDVYSFSAGFGNDTISADEGNANDTIVFDLTIAASDISFRQDGANLIIEVSGSNHIVLENWFGDTANAIKKFKIGSTTYSLIQTGTEGNNTLTGNDLYGDMLFGLGGDDTLDGLGKDDKLFGGDGADSLAGGAGNDFIDGGADSDTIVGGAGNDQIIYDSADTWANISGGDGNDTLDARSFISEDGYGIAVSLEGSGIEQILGSDYIDTLTGSSTANLLSGGTGDDVLEGKAGADTLIGGDGADSYVFGTDAGGNDVILKDGSNRIDTLVLAGVTDLSNSARSGNDLILDFGTQGKTILKSWNEGADYAITNVSMDDVFYSLSAGSVLADQISGTDGDDIILGLAGADKIDGGSGSDLLYGGNDADSLVGGEDYDTLWGGRGADTLTGGAGDDVLLGGNDADVYYFAAGFGSDTILPAANNANDIVEFDSSISTNSIEIYLYGSDLVIGVDGDEGMDTLILAGWNDAPVSEKVTKFRLGGQLYTIQRYLDETNAESGTITGNDYSELIIGSDTASTLLGNGGSDILIGSDGSEILDGGSGNDRIHGGAGDDTLTGGLGNDTYIFGADSGDDTITAASGNNLDKIQLADGVSIETISTELIGNDLVLYLGDSSLTIEGWNDGAAYKLTTLVAGNETFTLSGGSINGNDTGDGVDYNDVLTGTALADMINGLGGNDTLSGLAGNDILIGGTGNDILSGGAGSDNYRFSGFDFGHDTITGASDNSTDKLVFDFDAALADGVYGSKLNYFEFAKNGNDLIVSLPYGNDDNSITLANWYSSKIKQFVVNGQTYSLENFVQGNEADNSLSGTGTLTNLIYGLDGNDTIAGGTGNDLLYGGSGADSLYGAAGMDELYGGDGSDTLLGGDGNDILVDDFDAMNDLLDGGAGNDTIMAEGTGSDTLLGGLGNDVIADVEGFPEVYALGLENSVVDGGAGNDTIYVDGDFNSLLGGIGNDFIMLGGSFDTAEGGIGRDTLGIFDEAYGISLYGGNDNDLLIADLYSGSSNLLDGGAGNDELRSIASDTYSFGQDAGVTLRGGLGNDVYTISNSAFTTIDNSGNGANDSDFIQFYAGEENLIADYSFLQDGNDLLTLMGGTEVLRIDNWFLGSNYQVNKMVFSDGVLTAAQINNLVFIGSATDGADSIVGSAYGDQLAGLGGDDTLYGLAGNDLLDGGSGNDLLIGGEGSDTVVGGQGDDTIVYDGTQNLSAVYGNDGADVFTAADLGQGIKVTAGELTDFEIFLGGSGSDIINRSGLSNVVTVSGGAGDDTLSGGNLADLISGDSGDDLLSGGAGADTINGGEGSDILAGGSGADLLSGGSGNDTISGGSGNDLLSGGAGSDVYLFTLGSNVDVIDNSQDFQMGDTDTVLFGSGITADTIDILQDGNDLLVAVSGNDGTWPDMLVLENWFTSANSQVSGFVFTDGSTAMLTADEVTAAATTVLRAAANDTFLNGGNGSDWLYGSPGDQILYGGAGDDYYVWGSGDGNDRIDGTFDWSTYNDNGFDTVLIGFNANECWIEHGTSNDQDALVLGVGSDSSAGATSQTLIFDNWFSGTQYQVDALVFADGTTRSAQDIATALASTTYKHF